MRIAFLSRVQRRFDHHTLQTEALGGTQAALLHLSRELAALGHEVHIFAHESQEQVCEGVHWHPVPMLARFARQHALDLLIPVADELALKLGIPARLTLPWLHNDYTYLREELPDVRVEYAQLLATRCDKVLCVSPWHKQHLKEIFQLPAEHLLVLPNGIYPPYFKAEPTPASPPRLLYTSNPMRGLGRMLDLFERLQAQKPDVELHLYSSLRTWGSSASKNEALAGELYARASAMPGVMVHEPVPPAQLGEVLSQGNLWVYPQHALPPHPLAPQIWEEHESFCIAALEAQAAGLPVISSARGGLTAAVADGVSGHLIAGDPLSEAYAEAFVAYCLALLQDEVQRAQLGKAARQRALNTFSWAAVAQQLLAQLEELPVTRSQQAPLTSPFGAPRLSVIIPTYNRARNLAYCLESLTWQDFKDFEVLICDDGSSDNTREVVDSFRGRLNLRYRWQPDQGFRAAEARNMGLRMARGKVIVFLDSDLIVPKTFLSAHWQAIQETPQALINSYVYRMLEPIDDDLGLPPEEYIPKHRKILKIDGRDRYQLFEREGLIEESYFLDSNALSVTRELITQLGGFDADFVGWGHEDTELGYRIARHGIPMRLIKAGTEAYHLYHAVSETKEEERRDNWGRLTEKYGIGNWYLPLWELPVEGQVHCSYHGSPPPQGLSTSLSAAWILRTGHEVPLDSHHYQLIVDKGVLKEIRPVPALQFLPPETIDISK
ncbi:MAG: glycosyltransferase [Candidatus Sericytochromatia bacterium]|nr:glycosyltransferase [Candidatus Sericytochromatia bacterium]